MDKKKTIMSKIVGIFNKNEKPQLKPEVVKKEPESLDDMLKRLKSEENNAVLELIRIKEVSERQKVIDRTRDEQLKSIKDLVNKTLEELNREEKEDQQRMEDSTVKKR